MNLQWVVQIDVGSSGLWVLHGPFKKPEQALAYAEAYKKLNPDVGVRMVGLHAPMPSLLPPR